MERSATHIARHNKGMQRTRSRRCAQEKGGEHRASATVGAGAPLMPEPFNAVVTRR